jgi:hypothetical protein
VDVEIAVSILGLFYKDHRRTLEVIEAADYATWATGLSDAALKANAPKPPVAAR